MKLRIFWMLGAFIASVSASAASAQVMAGAIGAAVANSIADAELAKCRAGLTTLSEKEAGEADSPAQAAIARYWATASARDNVQIGDLFQQSGKAIWVANGVEVRVDAKPITDPFARTAGNILVEKPVVLVRGRDGTSARGIWEIRNSSGARAGYYMVDFVRRGSWSPRRLELLPADAPAPTVNPYCEKPGDIEAFREAAKAIPERQIAKTASKSMVVATCLQGADCSEKWSRARQWVQETGVFPLIRDTDTLLLTSDPVYADLSLAFVVVLDPPAADGRRSMRFRAWCGNMFTCRPTPASARDAFLAALQRTSVGAAQAPM